MGIENGLYALEREAHATVRYQHHGDDSTSLSHAIVYAVLQDRQNRLWVGTHNGLNLFDQETGCFRRYFYDTNKPDNTVLNIYEDEHGNLHLPQSDVYANIPGEDKVGDYRKPGIGENDYESEPQAIPIIRRSISHQVGL